MSSNKLDYKIKKYIHKLKNAETLDEAESYQKKLRQYHRINHFDSNSSLKGGVNDKSLLFEKKRRELAKQLNNMSGGMPLNKSSEIENLESKLNELQDLLEEMKNMNSNHINTPVNPLVSGVDTLDDSSVKETDKLVINLDTVTDENLNPVDLEFDITDIIG